ncbi:ornithine cyclodeaminase family protein [Streptomyces pinistramenti]|uniref:ornithine cyclodeaminase family protein n=1 Tax=Streptomyces pinistramenti TaxID=2884812 RepID=UPI001D08F8A9|nr:ornithine cyclodeaminase family protein [Streptomyces pinistramenti]MCB5908934.1 ornithine cyclodeaminase family protein [Streptomyces pinistramenti]
MTTAPRILSETDVLRALPMAVAIDALRTALREGTDPAADPPRTIVPVEHGQLLLMPAHQHRYAGVKVATVAPDNPAAGLPRVQGQYLLFDAATLAPLALLDGIALTTVRTAAVSALAADHLAAPDASRLVVFGAGPQARGHLDALRAVRPLTHVTVVGRTPERVERFAEAARRDTGITVEPGDPSAVATADLVACCTTARTPLFDGTQLAPHATVMAVGSHEPDAREVDDATVRGSTLVVESRAAAAREAGDLIPDLESGRLDQDALIPLADLVTGRATADPARPRFFKSVGMAWEDLAVAGAAYEAEQEAG